MLDLIFEAPISPTAATASISPWPAARIAAVEPSITAEAAREIDAARPAGHAALRRCAFPHGCDLSPRPAAAERQSGTLLEGIALWGELKPLLTDEAVLERALRYCDSAVAQGLPRHPQPCRHLRRQPARGRCAARGEAARSRPISTCSSSPSRRTATTARPARRESRRARSTSGVDVVGGIPHFERTMADGAAIRAGALRDRRQARPAGRHALRRDRRSAVAPYRDAGL